MPDPLFPRRISWISQNSFVKAKPLPDDPARPHRTEHRDNLDAVHLEREPARGIKRLTSKMNKPRYYFTQFYFLDPETEKRASISREELVAAVSALLDRSRPLLRAAEEYSLTKWYLKVSKVDPAVKARIEHMGEAVEASGKDLNNLALYIGMHLEWLSRCEESFELPEPWTEFDGDVFADVPVLRLPTDVKADPTISDRVFRIAAYVRDHDVPGLEGTTAMCAEIHQFWLQNGMIVGGAYGGEVNGDAA